MSSPNYRISEIVLLSTWAKEHGISPATARQRVTRGSLPEAFRIGGSNEWFIPKNTPLIDYREKEKSKSKR